MSVLIGVLLAAACGGSSPTAPQGPQYPAVAGSYAGSLTLTYPELAQSATCPASTTVTQTGANVSIAPLVLSGACVGLSIPIGSTTIDQNGSLGTVSNYTFSDPSCGTYTATASGGFFGRTFQFSMSAVSSSCWNVNVTAALVR